MYLHKKIAGLLLTAAMLTTSCSKLLDEAPPKDVIMAGSVFSKDASALGALSGLKTSLLSLGFLTSWEIYAAFWTDEARPENSSLGYDNFYLNSVASNNSTIASLWDLSYYSIYSSNAIIIGAANSPLLSKDVKERLLGEAHFIRAYLYFYLVQVYGEVPYIETTDYAVNRLASRKTEAFIYEKIMSDLDEAEKYLKPQNTTAERIHPVKEAVKAFKARVYLFLKNWKKAEQYATEIINNPLYKIEMDLGKVFLKKSTEAIWQLKPSTTSKFVYSAFANVIKDNSPSMSLAPSLLNDFEADDKRKTNWIGAYTITSRIPAVTLNYLNKYKVYSTNLVTEQNEEYNIVIRLSELYLIRAEAYAQQELYDEAKEDLKVIRNRAGLLNTTANDKPQLLNAILKERRVELFGEYGHRFMDLKRMNKIDEVLGANKTTWTPQCKFFPIPEKEMLLNPNF